MTRRFKVLVLALVMLLVTAGSTVALWARHDREEPVTVLGTWTAGQAERFETLLRGFGIPFRYQGTAAQREVLLAKVQAGEPPDIVIMPGIGELAEYADQHLLEPLDDLYDPREYGAPWMSAASPSDHLYWVPVKADLKSVVWYRQGAAPARGRLPCAAGASAWATTAPRAGPAPTGSRTSCSSGPARTSTSSGRGAPVARAGGGVRRCARPGTRGPGCSGRTGPRRRTPC